MSDDKTPIHKAVSRAYTTALERSRGEGGGCCGGAAPKPRATFEIQQPCCGPPAAAAHPARVASEAAGYSADEVARHADAARSSFGCGNPLAFAGVEPGQTVLDLGAGAGLDLLIAADKVGPTGKVIGVDMTDAMLEAARDNATRAGKAEIIDVRKGQIEALPVADASVDWVISNCVINLSPDKPAVFRELARVLKPGGRFSVSDIVAETLPADVKASAEAYSACIGGAISEGDYVAGLEAAGLVEVEVTERYVYDLTQLRGLVGRDLEDEAAARDTLVSSLAAIEGQVWSAKVTGRRA
ncbi:MAG: methyltransferase type 11 [Proteobacteria bacterium]|nr:MAG: methyltransferase type 11 [Pseudomonadota bacterium]